MVIVIVAKPMPQKLKTTSGQVFMILVLLLTLQVRGQTPFPPPEVERIWLGGEEVSVDSLLSLADGFFLPFEKNSITIQFVCPDTIVDHDVEYGYILEGYDSSWVDNGDQRRASFANLGSGNFLFRFRARHPGSEWVETRHPLKVSVTTPFWSYWWFPLVGLTVVSLILYGIYKIRINEAIERVLAMEKIRKDESEALRVTMAQDFHDEMGNKLASIIVMVSTLDLLIKDKTREIKEALTRIEADSKSLFSGTKTFIWSIDPKSDTLYEILNYIIHFGTDLFENTGKQFEVENIPSEDLVSYIMPVGVSRQIFFIFKEAMTNSLVHSGSGMIRFGFKINKSGSTIEIWLADDGKGITEKELKSSRGLSNMRSRAKKINGRLSLSNNPQGGFIVKLSSAIPDNHGFKGHKSRK